LDHLLVLLVRFPTIWQRVGLALASISFGSVLLGLRIGRRIDRAEHAMSRVGASIDVQLDKLLPWWLSPFIPESPLGFTAWVSLCFVGLVLAYTAKKIKRLYH